MRLDELDWKPFTNLNLDGAKWEVAELAGYSIWKCVVGARGYTAGHYTFHDDEGPAGDYINLDPMAAQCLLLEISSGGKHAPG